MEKDLHLIIGDFLDENRGTFDYKIFIFKTVEKKHYPKELTHYFGPKFEISPDRKRLRYGDW